VEVVDRGLMLKSTDQLPSTASLCCIRLFKNNTLMKTGNVRLTSAATEDIYIMHHLCNRV